MPTTQAMIDQLLADVATTGRPAASPGRVTGQRSPGCGVAPRDGRPRDPEVARILGLSVPVTATLAERNMTIESLLGISSGTIIEFDVPADAELTLYVANRPVGKGQTVKTGENFGLRITQIDTVERRIDALGGYERRNQKPEVGSEKSEVRSQKSEA